MSDNEVRFQLVEATFQNYDSTKSRYPLLLQSELERIIDVVKTVDTSHVYVDLEPAMKHIRQIVVPSVPTDDENISAEHEPVAHDSMLARMGAVMLLCSLIENRIRAMYRQRMALVQGTRTLTATEEAEIYEHIQNDPTQKYKLKRDVTDAARICRFLLWSHDVDIHTYHLLEQFTKVRNALVHDAMFRSEHFSDTVLGFLRRLYTHMQNMRVKMTKRLESERELYANDAMRTQRIARQLEGITVGTYISRLELYQRLAGSMRFDMPMINRHFCYVVAPIHAKGERVEVMREHSVKLLDNWQGFVREHAAPIPLFQNVPNNSDVVFRGFWRLTHVSYDSKNLFNGITLDCTLP